MEDCVYSVPKNNILQFSSEQPKLLQAKEVKIELSDINKLVQTSFQKQLNVGISEERSNSSIFENKDHSPYTRDPILMKRLHKILRGGYKVIYKRGTKRITIYRFLVAKLVYDREGLGLDEFLCFMDLNDQLNSKAKREVDFAKKYGEWLITTNQIISKLSTSLYFPIILSQSVRKTLRNVLVPYLPSQNAYYGYKKDPKIINPFRIRLRNPVSRPKIKQPTRYMGVGYKDKGHLRNSATDGPSIKDIQHAGLWRTFEEQVEQTTKILSDFKVNEEGVLFENYNKT